MGLSRLGLFAEDVRRVDIPWEVRFKTKHLGGNEYAVMEEMSGEVVDPGPYDNGDAQFLASEANRMLYEVTR